jgi:hypothetical protein
LKVQVNRPTATGRGKEEVVRKLIAAVSILAVVFVVGCQDTKKVTEIQGQLDKANQQITDLQTQLTTITAEKDSLAKVIVDMTAAKGAAKGGGLQGGTKKSGGGTGGGALKPPTKK